MIPKKGDLDICDNWRVIALLNVVEGCSENFPGEYTGAGWYPESQCGFRNA